MYQLTVSPFSLPNSLPFPHSSRQSLSYVLSLYICLFLTFPITDTIMCVFWWLVSFIKCSGVLFMLNVSVLHLYCWIIFHVLIQHILFIHLSDDGHLDYFHFLIIMKNATMNICVKVFVWGCVLIFLKKYLKEKLGHTLTLYLTFSGTAKLFPKWLGHFTFPPAMN